MKCTGFFLSLFFILSACKPDEKTVFDFTLPALNDTQFNFQQLKNYKATVISFFSPECPFSENYTKAINEFQQQYASQNIRFIIIIPGNLYPADTIRNFQNTYHVQPEIILDSQKKLTQFVGATITPETFVIDKKGKILYSGAIDNWAVSPGQKRQVITEFYLRDAIKSVLKDENVAVKKTNAVGCFIE